MLRIKKNCSILAALFFCVQVFLACTDSSPAFSIEEIAKPQTVLEDSTASGTVVSKPDTTAKDSIESDTTKKDTTELHTNSEDGDVVRTVILGDSTGELYSGKLYLDYPADSFLT